MIKVANNIQRMLEKQAQGPGQSIDQAQAGLYDQLAAQANRNNELERAFNAGESIPDYFDQASANSTNAPIQYLRNMAPRLPMDNAFRGLQSDLQSTLVRNPRMMNRGLAGLDRGYNAMVGPDGIPEFLRNANRFAGDTQQAASPLAQDYGNLMNQQAQYLSEIGNRAGNAANYVEQQLPAAANTAQSFVNSANQFRAGVAPAAQQASQTVNNAVQGVAGRLGSLGRGILNNARMIGTGFPVPTMPQPAPVPAPAAPAPRPVPVPGPNSA